MKNEHVYYILIGVLFVMARQATATNTVEFGVFDINTLAPIATATVQSSNGTLDLLTNTTDALGYTILFMEDTTYNITTTKDAYNTNEYELAVTTDANEFVYLVPQSTDGIVRVRFRDMTTTDHEICLYYDDNNRLHGCYFENDTIKLLINRNYTLKPMSSRWDIFTSAESVKDYTPFVIGLSVGGGFLLILAWIIIYFTRQAWGGKR